MISALISMRQLRVVGSFLTACLCLVSTSFADSALEVLVVAESAAVYIDPSPTSKVLTHYPASTRLTVFQPSRKGFYLVYFEAPLYGYSEGWIDGSTLKLIRMVSSEQSLVAQHARRSSLAWEAIQGMRVDRLGRRVTTNLQFDSTRLDQTSFQSSQQLNLNAALQMDFQKKYPQIEYGGSAAGTLAPVKKTLPDVKIWYLRLGAYVGYSFILDPAVKLSLMGEVDLSGTFTSNSNLGYSPLIYPLVYPKLEFVVTPKLTALIKAWYAPIGGPILGFHQYDRGGELRGFYRLERNRAVSIALLYRQLKFSDDQTFTHFQQNSLSVSIGYTVF
ncbi:hypothetical protein EBS43_05845 [bacterium]|jgi:hypothetical protein|nr:hypothetical protein [bacterium]